jgi:hypothetical protein
VYAGKEVVWVQHLMGELGFLVETSTVVYYANQSVIQVEKNPIAHSKLKNVELHAHYLRHLVQENVVNLVYYRKDDQVVDIFMKPISETTFVTLQTMLGFQGATIVWVYRSNFTS